MRKNKAVASCSLILMASGPIISWQIDGAKVESVTDFTFVGSKITMDGDQNYPREKEIQEGKVVF